MSIEVVYSQPTECKTNMKCNSENRCNDYSNPMGSQKECENTVRYLNELNDKTIDMTQNMRQLSR